MGARTPTCTSKDFPLGLPLCTLLKGAHYSVSPNPLQAPDLLDPALSPMLGCRCGPILQAFSTPRGALCRWSRLPLRDKIGAICACPQHPPIFGFKPDSTVLLKLFSPTPTCHSTSASRCFLILFFLLLGPALPQLLLQDQSCLGWLFFELWEQSFWLFFELWGTQS